VKPASHRRWIPTVLAPILLAACVTSHEEGVRPVAVPGPDRALATGVPTVLDASRSYLPGSPGAAVAVEWALAVQPRGANLTLPYPEDVRFSFVPTEPGLYVFRLVARSGGLESRPAFLNLRVKRPEVIPDPEQWTVEAEQERLLADGTGTTTLIARGVRDGEPILGRAVRFTTTAGTLEGPVTGLSNGRYLQTLRAAGTPGRAEIHLYVDETRVGPAAFVDFVAGPAHRLVRISGNGQSGQTAEPLPAPLVVAVRDAQGHPVAGTEVSWSVVSGGAIVDPLIGVTDANGLAETVATLGTTIGLHRFRAEALDADGAPLEGSPVHFDASALPGEAHAVEAVDGDDQTTGPGEALPAPLRVRVVDLDGNPLEGVPIIWEAPDGGDVEPSAVETGPDGIAATTATAPTGRGSHLFRALAGDIEGSPVLFEATVVPGAPASLVLVSGDGQSGTVGEAVAELLVVRVVDAFGNGIEDVRITWTARDGGVVMADGPRTDADGYSRATATLGTTPGTKRYRAAPPDHPGLAYVQFELAAEAGPPARFEVLGHPSPARAGEAATLTVVSRDAYDNTTPFDGLVALSTDAPSANLPETHAVPSPATSFDIPGIVLRAAGTFRIDVVDAGRPEDLKGAQEGILVTAADAQSTLEVSGSPVAADGESPLLATVTLRDADAVPVTGASVAILADPLGSVGAVTEIGDGVYEAAIVSTEAGETTISFTAEGLAFTDTAEGCFGLACDPPGAARIRLDIDAADLGEDLLDFPLLVVLDDGRIDYARTSEGGADLRFVDAGHTRLLPHEIERWDPDGVSWVWVRVPRIDAADPGAHLWLYFDDPEAEDASDPTSVWDADFRAVWHLSDDPMGTAPQMRDSTGRENHATLNGPSPESAAEGPIAGAVALDGTESSSDWLEAPAPDAGSLDITGAAFTIEAWVWLEPDRDEDADGILTKADENRAGQYFLGIGGGGSNHNHVLCRTRTGGSERRLESSAAVPEGAWTHVACRYDGARLVALVDGEEVGAMNVSGPVDARSGDVWIGRRYDGRRFGGAIDEVRISSVPRSDAWMAFQHRSMTDDLLTFGDVEDLGEDG
jgi:hypothetical protein